MTRTLVTGAAGFTGRYLTSLLARRGHEVHGVIYHEPDEAVIDAAALHSADLADRDAILRVVEQVRPDHVVHLAAIAFVGHDDIGEMYRANVYGNTRSGVLDEAMLPAPANDYGVSKAAAEYVGRLYAEKLPLITVRPFNYTGRGQDENFLIPKIIAHARRRAPVIELGNLDVARDFSDVRTVVDAYARLLDSPAAIGGTFNICSGLAVRLDEILELVASLSSHRPEVRINPALVRADEVKTLSGSSAKLEAVIGELKGIGLADTLRWMLED